LFTVCGSTYNTSAGQSAPTAGNFRVPNLKGRMPVGLDAGVTDFNTPGKSGGSTTVTITVAQLPVHKHANTAALTSGTVSITDPGHGHTITDPGHGHTINDHTHTNQVTTIIPAGAHAHDNVTDYVSAGTNGASPSPTVSSISTTSLSANSNTTGVSAVSNTTGISGSVGTGITVTNVDTGSGNAVDNMSPYLVLNYIIKT
jgi:microcystin-dependent protein